jgi:dGTPase
LNLNEDLTEAIALGHDLGHTPFGHIGEESLNELCPEGFRHNEQSLRVVDLLENDGQGLNLCWEVRDGILNHSKGQIDIPEEGWADIGTVEGQVCKIADIVAYINHDVDDAIRAGCITKDDLPASTTAILGSTHSQRINTLVRDIVSCSRAVSGKDKTKKATISMSPDVLQASNKLRQFLFDKVYDPSLQSEDADRAKKAMRLLYSHFVEHEDELPTEFSMLKDSKGRKAADYLAGMTDQYALRAAEEISG